jgi:hypothetical protein
MPASSKEQAMHRMSLAAMSVAFVAACSASGFGVRAGEQSQIGLQRGGHWSTLSVRPPYLAGPQFLLRLERGLLTGLLGGEAAVRGSLRVRIDREGVAGHGPLGAVAVDFVPADGGIIADGLWNGTRLHVAVMPHSLEGTVGVDPERPSSCCSYDLTGAGAGGALSGVSICDGMPQPTRLEVPPMAQSWLSAPELTTLLLVLLSTPPLARSEGRGSRFDSRAVERDFALPEESQR